MELLIGALTLYCMFKLTIFGFRMTWGLFKFVLYVFLVPFLIFGTLIGNLLYFAFPLWVVYYFMSKLLERDI